MQKGHLFRNMDCFGAFGEQYRSQRTTDSEMFFSVSLENKKKVATRATAVEITSLTKK